MTTTLLRDALIENLHRQQLNPLEEAAAYQQLLDDFEATHEELARKIGRSRAPYQQHHPAAEPAACRAAPRRGGRAERGPCPGTARASRIRSAGAPGHRIVAEGLSVRAVEEIVALGSGDGHGASRRPARAAQPTPRPRPSGRPARPTRWRPGSRSNWVSARERSSSSSPLLDDLDRIVKAISPSRPARSAAATKAAALASRETSARSQVAQP